MLRREYGRAVAGIAAVVVASVLAPLSWALAQEAPRVLDVGEMAPDFEVLGATRWGVLEKPVRLSDFRGKSVVLAFFYRVRTPG